MKLLRDLKKALAYLARHRNNASTDNHTTPSVAARPANVATTPNPVLDYIDAVERGDLNAVTTYLSQPEPVDVDMVNQWGSSGVYLAAEKGFIDMVRLLISKGANVNSTNMMRMTPLHIAAELDETSEIVKLLLAAPNGTASINAKNAYGNTPLHRAAASKYYGNIILLIQHDADPTILNLQRESPCDLAIVTDAMLQVKVLKAEKAALLTQHENQKMSDQNATVTQQHMPYSQPDNTQKAAYK